MNKLFLYLVAIGVLILVLLVAWEVVQINSGAKSNINQIVIGMPRENIFTTKFEKFLSDKLVLQSGLSDLDLESGAESN